MDGLPGVPGERARPVPRRRPAPLEGEDTPEQSATSDQCGWLAKRIIGLLVRDDAMAANDFIPFYLRFGCSEERLAKSFGCVVATIGAVDNSAIADHIEECWFNPAVRPEMPGATTPPSGSEPEQKPAADDAKPEKKAGPSDLKPAEPKPAEQKPAEAKPAQPKMPEPRPGEPKPVEPGQKTH